MWELNRNIRGLGQRRWISAFQRPSKLRMEQS